MNYPVYKLLPVVLLMGATLVSAGTAAAEHKAWHSGMSATIELRFNDGYRVDSAIDNPMQSLIANASNHSLWFEDHDRQIAHQVPASQVSRDQDTAAPIVRLPGYIDSIACFGQSATQLDDVVFKDTTVQAWQCAGVDIHGLSDQGQPDDSLPVLQYYSVEKGLVVYSLNEMGIETELTTMTPMSIDADIFIPTSGLRKVSVEEFFGTAIPIGLYDSVSH